MGVQVGTSQSSEGTLERIKVVPGELGESVTHKCFPWKQEGLGLIPKTHMKNLGVVASAYGVSLGKWRQAGRFLGLHRQLLQPNQVPDL